MAILSAENITINYSEKPLLENISLYIEQKDKIGVIGINGTGKSTLLKIIAGIEFAQSGTVTTASGMKIGYLPQNPDFTGEKTVIEQVFSTSKDPHQEIKVHEAKAVLTKLGITEFDKKIEHLSGGQKKRVAIASAIITPCELLILDEPTNHLDNKMVAYLEKMLNQYSGAILMVTHDRYFLDRVTNRIVEIDNASLYNYQANYTKFLELKAMREQSQISSERKRQTILRRELEWIQRGPQGRGTKSKSRIDSYNNLLNREAPTEKTKIQINSISTRLGRKTIEINSVSKSFDNKCVVKGFSYIINRDARIGIVGANGSGKSTLLNLISGKIKPDSGNVVVGDTVKIGYFSQECEQLDMNEKVIDYIKSENETIETVDGVITASQMLERFLFPANLQWNIIGKLSGGERRRLFLLKIIMGQPNILLLDEPTNDLDIQTLSILEDYLEGFSGAVITVSHDRYFLDRVVDSIFELSENGQLKEYLGGYTDYLNFVEEEKNQDVLKQKKKDEEKKQNQPKPKKLKFTFKEQREFDTIEDEITEIENQIITLNKEIEHHASDYNKLENLIVKRQEIEEKLDEKLLRWEQLSELDKKIRDSYH
jgi:ATP-binding cassette subfamily F protein uup